MDLCLNDLLFEFLLHNYPDLLSDPEAFGRLCRLVHALMHRAVIEEKRVVFERLQKVSLC